MNGFFQEEIFSQQDRSLEKDPEELGAFVTKASN